ncbi:hypothetical protein HU200_016870 [Digitaria exilis]|uniref:Uncharacterized protein n=1 Tax=Digitaria exilis TaxID=1010633 RepID=A0A835KJP6_9POAL|nr:hypothetical protein HU200_016870 [Digitaria exilis]
MEAAATTTTTAAVQNELNSPAALSHSRSATICVLSLVFPWLATLTLRHIDAGDEKEKDHFVSAAVVRDLSPLAPPVLHHRRTRHEGLSHGVPADHCAFSSSPLPWPH